MVVGTAVVGTNAVVPSELVVGAVVVGDAVLGAAVVGVVVAGGVYLGAVVVGGVCLVAVVVGAVCLAAVVVGAMTAFCGGVVVELVEPVTGPGTSACAVRVIEPKAWLSLAFCAASSVSRAVSAASSSLRTAIAAASPAVEASACGAGGFPNMAFEACSMYCLAFAGLCLAR
ncbi:MAG TPA: hypothetical protein VMS00_00515 [Acidimicrobiales bacterium]|nr:hypothetical protein [Acidimicrobiales bacterium]